MQAVSSGLDNVQPMQSTSRPTGHWFDGRSLARLTDPITWQRGMALYVSQHVLSLDIVPSGAGWILLGEVLGSKRDTYEVSIELALTSQGQVAQWDSLCECPVGVQCKHGVALMLKAAQQGLRARPAPRRAKFTNPSMARHPTVQTASCFFFPSPRGPAQSLSCCWRPLFASARPMATGPNPG
jgi:uncharacterized Zn finger protein